MASQNDYHINQNWPTRGAVTAATVEEWGNQCIFSVTGFQAKGALVAYLEAGESTRVVISVILPQLDS